MIEMSVQTRTYFVLGVMFACFAILYPKIFHPMILSALGWNRQVSNNHEYMTHPRDRMMHRPGGPGPGPGGPGRPHPGMRMGGESPPGRSTGGGRGGVMGMVLPIYAVGIVLYLIYTLVKVFGGNSNSTEKNRERKEAILREYYRNLHYDPDKGKFRLGRGSDDEDQTDDESEMQRSRRNGSEKLSKENVGRRSLPRDLERLLRKVDDKNITESEMRELRDRLEETERQMTRILEAMKEVQSRVDPVMEADGDRCECQDANYAEYKSAEETRSEGKADGDKIENLASAQSPAGHQEMRHRRVRGEDGSRRSERARTGSDSTESEEEEYMDLEDGYEAEADEKDDEVRPRHQTMNSPESEYRLSDRSK